MHKRTAKRNTFSSTTEKIKAPEHLSRLQDYENDYESTSRVQLPSLPKRKSWKDVDNSATSWDQSSPATSVSWSPEMEDVATSKLVQQWEAIERTLYDEDEQVSQTSILEECIQWRMQNPHLRIVGKNIFAVNKEKVQSANTNNSSNITPIPRNEEIFSEHSPSARERKSSSKSKSHKSKEDDVMETILSYVISELSLSKKDERDFLHDDFSDVLKINAAPIYSNKSSARSEARFFNYADKRIEDRLLSAKTEAIEVNHEANQKRYKDVIYSGKSRGSSIGGRGDRSTLEDRFYRPHTGRNKLGTVFNEKIVVSPVPYVLSTKESFSTLRTTPIKFMGQSLAISSLQGSGRNISTFRNLTKNSIAVRTPNSQSAWHAPVCPTVWPKNIKLAPIDTSRLPSSKNRSMAPSPTGLQRNRKSLSPISHSTLPVSAHSVMNNNSNKDLEIQGRHISPGHSAKLNLFSPKWDYSPRITKSRKKKGQVKEEIQ